MSTHLWPLPITRLGKAANNNSPKTWLIRSQAVFVDHFSQVISTFLIWVWININTIFRGMNIHLHPFTGYFDVHQGYKVLTHCHIPSNLLELSLADLSERCFPLAALSGTEWHWGAAQPTRSSPSIIASPSVGAYWTGQGSLVPGVEWNWDAAWQVMDIMDHPAPICSHCSILGSKYRSSIRFLGSYIYIYIYIHIYINFRQKTSSHFGRDAQVLIVLLSFLFAWCCCRSPRGGARGVHQFRSHWESDIAIT